MSLQYFREKLSLLDKQIYDHIFKALVNRKLNCTVPKFTNQAHLEQILNYILQDNPSIFYIQSYQLKFGFGISEILPIYTLSGNMIELISKECEQRARSIAYRVRKANPYDTLICLHDEIVKTITYRSDGTQESHSIVAPLTGLYGVCEGFAKTIKYILDIIDIPCIVVKGNANDPVSKMSMNHAWNMVKINGEWYHFDVTFDTTIRSGNLIRYDYFALPNKEILNDHNYNEADYPFANNISNEYYTKNNLLMVTRKQMTDYIGKCLRNNINEFIVKLPSEVSNASLDQKVLAVAMSYLTSNNCGGMVQISSNLNQRVFQISIT